MYNQKIHIKSSIRQFLANDRYDLVNIALAPITLPLNIFKLTSYSWRNVGDYRPIDPKNRLTRRILGSLLGISIQGLTGVLLYPEIISPLFHVDMLISAGFGIVGSAYATISKR